jgi:hypothetical protein
LSSKFLFLHIFERNFKILQTPDVNSPITSDLLAIDAVIKKITAEEASDRASDKPLIDKKYTVLVMIFILL